MVIGTLSVADVHGLAAFIRKTKKLNSPKGFSH
jgi:hypothetical protein